MSWIQYYSLTSFTTWVTEQKVHAIKFADNKRLRKKDCLADRIAIQTEILWNYLENKDKI